MRPCAGSWGGGCRRCGRERSLPEGSERSARREACVQVSRVAVLEAGETTRRAVQRRTSSALGGRPPSSSYDDGWASRRTRLSADTTPAAGASPMRGVPVGAGWSAALSVRWARSGRSACDSLGSWPTRARRSLAAPQPRRRKPNPDQARPRRAVVRSLARQWRTGSRDLRGLCAGRSYRSTLSSSLVAP